MRTRHFMIALVLLVLALPASPAQAGGVVSACNETALTAALAGGGTVTFSCSGTITVTSTLGIAADVTIDGSGQNVVLSGGGAVGVFVVKPGVTLNLNKLTVADGKADSGGGILNDGGTVTVSNSTFSGNSAGYGGGIVNDGGTVTVSNSTFSGNSAEVGGGIETSSGTATLENTLVANSPAGGNCSGTITDGGGNLSYGDATCPGVNGDPKLGPLQANGGPTQTMALGAGSAARDAADDAICAAPPVNNLDQRGVARPQGAHCDIGALID